MLPHDFGPRAPGQTVPTTFEERTGTAVRTVEGHAFVPDPLPPKLKPEDLYGCFNRLISAERGLARLDGLANDLPHPSLLWSPLSRREAILSSRIEDTIASAEELVLAEAGETPERNEVVEVVNYIHALRHGLESDLPICLRLIRQMHQKLLGAGVRGRHGRPGHFRDDQNYIGDRSTGFGGARFVPPPPAHLMEGLSDFEQFVNRKQFGIPKLVAIALMHYQFEALHPFRDGNGRIGRLLAALSLCRYGLINFPFVYLSGFFESHREQYNELLLRVSTHGEWIPWIDFFLQAICEQAEDAEKRVRDTRKLRRKYRRSLEESNAPSRIMKAVDFLFEHPIATADRIGKHLEVSKPTAHAYLSRLVDIGALVELPREYRKIWIATEILTLTEADDDQKTI